MKRIGLGVLVLLMILLVFSAEGILALLRTRHIEAVVIVQGRELTSSTQTATATPEATATLAPNTTPDPTKFSVLTITANQTLAVRTRWEYRIGPRFPDTLLHAEVIDQKGQVVASSDYTITCGSSSLDCSGEQALSLAFGVKDDQGTPSEWPEGDYLLRATWQYAGVIVVNKLIDSATLHVKATQ